MLLAAGGFVWGMRHQPPRQAQPGAVTAPGGLPAGEGPAPQPRQELPERAVTAGWVAAAPGADYCVRAAGGGVAQVAAVRVDLARYRAEVADLAQGGRKEQTVRELVAARGAVAAINGGYFDRDRRPLGALVHAGKQSNPPSGSGGGFFCVVGGRAVLRETGRGLPSGVTEALQCYPLLVVGGRAKVHFKPGEAVRAGVGITARGEVVLAVTCRGDLSLRDWAAAMHDLGCTEALNLDGGPSSQLYFHAGKTELDLPGTYAVPAALVVVRREGGR